SPYPLERSLGISWYATGTEGIGGYLRREPEDFLVEEEPAGSWGDSGNYLILRVTRRNWEQQRLVKELARALGISHRRISWAGTKDRRAVATQYMAVLGIGPEALERVTLPDVRIGVAGRSDRPLALGELRGNRFLIRIRDCDPEDLAPRVAAVAGSAGSGFPNYVGIQRFGAIRPVTHLVGERILRGDPEGAALSYLGASFPTEPPEVREAREIVLRDGDVKGALRRYPVHLTFERAMLHHLDGHPGDHAGALHALPPRLLSLFVSAFQSFLWNTLLSLRCGKGIPLDEPAPGDRVVFPDGREDLVTAENLGAALLQVRRKRAQVGLHVPGAGPPEGPGPGQDPGWQILRELGISREDFASASRFVGVAYSGMTRAVALFPEIESRVEGNDVILGFFLGPGQYATTVCREFMKADPLRMS
ncbi:MAG: tRNA pseudouridine(13) synthase TruD, partial [Methanomicrobiales archaeon]|nr:tRNA pseudouridine(13) synthase TruD [Methanomicrobiales archaeon]